MTIGEKIKEVRLFLGLNRKEFVHEIIDESYLASIEKGKSEIRAIDLIAILQQNNLSVISFLSGFGNTQPSLSIYEDEASNAFFAHDIQKLNQISNACSNEVIKDVIQLMIAKLNKQLSSFSNHEKEKIKKIFWQMEKWDSDSLWIMSNVMEIYNFDELEGMVHSVWHSFNSFSKYKDRDRDIKLLATITFNYLQICLTQVKKNQSEIEKAGAFLAQLPSIPAIAYEKIKGEYALILNQSDYKNAEEVIKVLHKSKKQ